MGLNDGDQPWPNADFETRMLPARSLGQSLEIQLRMRIQSVTVENIKSVRSVRLSLSPTMNILIGHNNAGKSILINAIYAMQDQSAINPADTRINETHGTVAIDLSFESGELERLAPGFDPADSALLTISINRQSVQRLLEAQREDAKVRSRGGFLFQAAEPLNAIYPFLSKRKVMTYDEHVNLDKTSRVTSNFEFLVSKVDRLSSPGHRRFAEFREACREIIGFTVDTLASPGGHRIGFPVGDSGGVTLERMGEGVPHLLALIADLCIAKGKVFLIEEPENDLHPRALKNLLNLIVAKTRFNQFIVATHSNIVARYLGAVGNSKMVQVRLGFVSDVPTTTYEFVDESPDQRRMVLEELGYEMTDYGLWAGWLILEESSAERIVRDILIPWFAPGLVDRLRTISASGVDQVEAKFQDFDRLFLFTHLTRAYHNHAWVVVDGGPRGEAVIQRLRNDYRSAGWDEGQFRTLSRSDFEFYYPNRFEGDVAAALALPHGLQRQRAKGALVEKVMTWAREEPEAARAVFAESAHEVIELLREIEGVLGPAEMRSVDEGDSGAPAGADEVRRGDEERPR